MREKNLRGKVVLVTGSTSGIGLGIAEVLAEAGAHVMLNGFASAEDVAALREKIARAHDVEVEYSGADMSNPEQIREMFAATEARFGRVDVVVNNAGIQHVAPVEEFPAAKWESILAINLSANFYCMQAAIPQMKRRGWGRIINIASVHGVVASPFKSAYVAAKHGVVGLTKTLALELAETPITCNAICPGYVHTPLVEKQIEQQAEAHGIARDRVIREVLLAAQPSKRFVEVDQVARLAHFLTTDAASGMTGSILTMDGGWTAR